MIPSPSLPLSPPLPVSAPPPASPIRIALGPRYEVRQSSFADAARPAGGLKVDYGFIAIMDKEIRRDLERDVGYGITDSWDEIDIDEIYTRLDDEQSKRQLMAGQLNMLYKDRRAHARTARLMKAENWITAGSDYRATGSRPQEAGGDYRDAGGKSQEAEAVY
ncbi:hypothetical protein Tco_0026112 [Tanacetum coccineum]